MASKFLISICVLIFSFSSFNYVLAHRENNLVSDGILKLIIKSYIDEIITNEPYGDEPFRQKIHLLSGHIVKHPALYQKRLYVGQDPPLHDPFETSSIQQLSHRGDHPMKRQFANISTQVPAEEICSTNRQWEQINKTKDINDNEVDIVQQEGQTQFVYTYRCSSEQASSCIGISPLYHSECTERYGWVYMLYKKKGEEKQQWGYVAAPHHCACKIQPKLINEVIPTE